MASRRLQVLGFVTDYIARSGGEGPSVREIAAALQISTTRVKQHLKTLIARGELLRRPGGRGLMLPSQLEAALRTLRDLGVVINPGVERAPCPETTLPEPLALSYRDFDG